MPRLLSLSRCVIVTALLSLAGPALAELPAVGKTVSPVTVQYHGELLMKGDEAAFQPWSSSELNDGKYMHVLLYMAATLGASSINTPFTNQMDMAGLPKDRVQTTSILNLEDATWGSAPFVLGQLKVNKKKHPEARLVADTTGAGLRAWNLQRNNYAVGILSPEGKVLFFKEGALTPDEIRQALELLRTGAESIAQRLPSQKVNP